MNVATKICIFAALVASYDLLLGYTGSVSFAHTMFYGIGSYAIAIALYSMGPNWAAVATGVVDRPAAGDAAGARHRTVLAAGRGDLFRDDHAGGGVRLSGAGLATVVADRRRGRPQLSTAGIAAAGHGTDLERTFGFELNGRVLTYYIIFVACAAMILALLRVVNSPFGRVLQAIRENRFRAEALGFRTVFHLTYANCLAALVAASAGMLNALWLRYAGPDTSLSFSIMLDISADGGDRRHGHDLRRDHRRRPSSSWRRTICRR